MPDMYDKLGDLLNEALESGKIPQNKETPVNDRDISDEKSENPGHFNLTEEEKAASRTAANEEKPSESGKNTEKNSEKLKNFTRIFKKKQIPRGQVIKMHKYTYNMQFPDYIQKALATLDIAYPFTIKSLQKQYHKLLKENHPDRQNTIQKAEGVQNIRQISINEIIEAYKVLSEYFAIK